MKAKDPNLTAERVRQALNYDPNTGIFTWADPGKTKMKIGAIAGGAHNGGYRVIGIDGHIVLAHRLAWLHIHGEWPTGEIDHINQNKQDNRIANLRVATRFQNGANRGANSNNACGLRGVHWHRQSKRWRASIRLNGKVTSLGLHTTKEAASAAYQRAAAAAFGEFSGGAQ
jgi:hypothetical protein